MNKKQLCQRWCCAYQYVYKSMSCGMLLLLSSIPLTGYSQNTFPPFGNAGIGTTSPSTDLQIGDFPGSLSSGTRGMLIRFAPGTTDRALLELHDPTGVNRTVFQSLAAYSELGSLDTKPLLLQLSGGNVGIGIQNPTAQLHVYETDPLGPNLNNAKLLSVLAGTAPNYFAENKWLVREAGGGGSWTNVKWHDALSIDNTFATPGTDTKTWWERQPYQDVQAWGTGNTTYMKLAQGRLGIGTTAAEDRFQVNGATNKVVIGSAAGSGLHYGTAYIGFNASRDNAIFQQNSTWKVATDGANNGGGAIFGDLDGNLYLAGIPSTFNGTSGSGGSNQLLTDAVVANNVALKVWAKGGTVQIGPRPCISHLDARLAVDGKLVCKDFYVMAANHWPDYVFAPTYELPALNDVQKYYQTNSHLPDVPSAEEIKNKGINIGEMSAIQMQKIEELYLYVMKLNDRMEALQRENNLLKEKIGRQ